MRVIGIDPGTARMGFGVVEDTGGRQRALAHGVFSTPAGRAQEVRLQQLYAAVREMVETHRPDALAVESLFFGRNVTTALTVGQARGVVLLAAADAALPVREFTPVQVKQAVTGYGRADKAQVQQMVGALLQLAAPPRPDDAADALAVALCCLQSWPLQARLGGLKMREERR